jgi:imidazolonepropionase-like amidohydrolase
MRHLPSTLIALFALACAPAAAQDSYAITNVTVVPMDSERLLADQTVVIRGGRIEALGPAASTAAPPGATRIDGRGRFLMPGLAEMHAHVPPNPADGQWSEDVLTLYVANGVTFARSMLGAPHHLPLRAKAARGEILSPRIYASGPSFNGDSVASPDDGRRMVREQKAAGYDMLKIHPGLDRARYDAIAETARELDIPFAGHVPDGVGLARALEAGQATIDHLDGYVVLMAGKDPGTDGGLFGMAVVESIDDARIPEIARRTRAAGVWNVPTNSLPRHLLQASPSADEMMAWPEMRYVPAGMRADWRKARASFQSAPGFSADRARRYLEARDKMVKALQDAGAGLLLGSDSPQWFNVPGFALHRELAYLVDAGLTPYQALASGTVNVARFLGEAEAFGTVAVGRRADLILLEANPLADVANAQRRVGVMLGGRWLPESDLRERLDAIAARYRD